MYAFEYYGPNMCNRVNFLDVVFKYLGVNDSNYISSK